MLLLLGHLLARLQLLLLLLGHLLLASARRPAVLGHLLLKLLLPRLWLELLLRLLLLLPPLEYRISFQAQAIPAAHGGWARRRIALRTRQPLRLPLQAIAR